MTGKNILDLYRFKVNKNIDGLIAVTKKSFCAYTDCYPSDGIEILGVKKYNPVTHWGDIIICHDWEQRRTAANTDYEMHIRLLPTYYKKTDTASINFYQLEGGDEDQSILKKKIELNKIPYIRNKSLKCRIRKLIKRTYLEGIIKQSEKVLNV